MPRRRAAEPRIIEPDPRYNSENVARFINKVMERGKKSVARQIVYRSFEIVQEEMGRDPLDVFDVAIRTATPQVQVRPRRVGGATYQVPVEVHSRKGTTYAMRWIVESARARTGSPMRQKLAEELMEASRGQGAAVRRRENLHRMAEANQAFAHYRW
ncbi:MAG: 30S ribosomal protein S7 [SAR202 cluster bacterium]|nr:30S ribosomal protein S7 [SAR202 cluster bacterium]|tara:strand:- start:1776 stop:2246 length:471 start_codon:yes stop_codon:yes gene_type:complete